MNKKSALVIFLMFFSFCVNAQNEKPKLVVGIVVDQMRQEYLSRFESVFGEDGFKRLQREGFELKNAHYNYMPTTTGPGHAAVYTGTTPAYNGIVYNNWFDQSSKREYYCVEDTLVDIVGGNTAKKRRGASPRNLMMTTVTDELELFSQFRSKVLSISIKDRSAILGGGHQPDGAYWYDSNTRQFVTSTYYRKELPQWLKNFNAKKLPDAYIKKAWDLALSKDKYKLSRRDQATFEQGIHRTTFPYSSKDLHDKNKKRLALTPYGDDILIDLAKAGIEGENLGKGNEIDFLAISFSSPDKIGHSYGPQSVEIEDTYIRLDRNVADLMNYLDQQVGKGEYVLFLTADHAVSEIPTYLEENNMPGGYFDLEEEFEDLNEYLSEIYGKENWVPYYDFFQFNFDRQLIAQRGIDLDKISQQAIDWLQKREGVVRVFTAKQVNLFDYEAGGYKGMLARGFFPKRSGDGFFVLGSGWLCRSTFKGTSHGSPFTYDTNVPMLWFGKGIPHGSSVNYHPITDLATTLSVMLGIKLPSGATGEVINELFENK